MHDILGKSSDAYHFYCITMKMQNIVLFNAAIPKGTGRSAPDQMVSSKGATKGVTGDRFKMRS